MTEKQLRAKVVATAVAWMGCKEADGSHRKIIDLYNTHKPLARGYAVKYTDAWCATYVSAVAIKTGVEDILPLECGCGAQIELFKRLGRWQESDAYTPAAGDVLYYDWDDNGAGDCTGAPEHVGLVTAVEGKKITIIEGNKGNAVAYRAMQVNGRYIRGYGLPDYARKAARNGTTVAGAIAKLEKLGVINSPDYWIGAVPKVQYLGTLLVKAAEEITKAGARTETPEQGVAALVSAGVINTPDYWLANYGTFPSLGTLLCALGGAVK